MKLSEMKPQRAKQVLRSDSSLIWLFNPREMREKQGVSLRDAAKAAGISAATLSRVERGHVPDLLNALKLSEFYGYPLTVLWAVPPAKKARRS